MKRVRTTCMAGNPLHGKDNCFKDLSVDGSFIMYNSTVTHLLLLDICLRFSLRMINAVKFACALFYNTTKIPSPCLHVTHDTLQKSKFIP